MIEIDSEEFEKNFELYLEKAQTEVLHISKDGQPSVVILSLSEYNRLVQAGRSSWLRKNREWVDVLLQDLETLQSNAGSNDFDLEKFVPDIAQRRALMKQFHELNGDPENFDPMKGYEIIYDFALTVILKNWLDQA